MAKIVGMLDDGPALEVLGISAFDERVYRAVLASPGITVQELVMRSGESSGRIQSSLSRLRAKGMVNRLWGRSPRWTATSPGTAIRSLVRGLQSELDRITETADAMEAAFRTVGQDPDEVGQFEVLAGPEELARWYLRVQQEARDEVLTFDRPPYVLDYRNPLQSDRLRDGVRYRTIYAPEAFQHEGALDELDNMLKVGEEARVLPGLPFKMVLVDQRVAIMPLHLHPPLSRSVLIRGSTMVVALVELFERMWREAVPMYPRAPSLDRAPEPAGVRGEEPEWADLDLDDRRLLALLAAGLKDDAIARQFGTSPRSLRRRLRHLFDELNAETRFQAGVQANRRGLV
ncbi:transcriptional regulator [Acrocarpospora phusangensis]|uniref:Transcriptional regulator n=1 Tax=Acrocarpospora phusangensis TaxID=1070424 RepID=A0A919Q5M6_9ACTN|nr:helix-turn-helix domain-containing protein [Acrocarpospora phusangensis]GIH22601.1 transcriptional regulator [Acrocarpospora phusangensis]